jgi:hypothetical protein
MRLNFSSQLVSSAKSYAFCYLDSLRLFHLALLNTGGLSCMKFGNWWKVRPRSSVRSLLRRPDRHGFESDGPTAETSYGDGVTWLHHLGLPLTFTSPTRMPSNIAEDHLISPLPKPPTALTTALPIHLSLASRICWCLVPRFTLVVHSKIWNHLPMFLTSHPTCTDGSRQLHARIWNGHSIWHSDISLIVPRRGKASVSVQQHQRIQSQHSLSLHPLRSYKRCPRTIPHQLKSSSTRCFSNPSFGDSTSSACASASMSSYGHVTNGGATRKSAKSCSL